MGSREAMSRLEKARELRVAALRLESRIEDVMREATALRQQGEGISGHGQFADHPEA